VAFSKDEKYAAEVGRLYGDYLTTYTSNSGQTRAYLFRKSDGRVEAHVSFQPGVFASANTDPYVTDLWAYARAQGFPDRFQLILS
jgi:hypothetical protein